MRAGFIDWTEGKLCLYVFEKKGNQHTLLDTIAVPIKDELNPSHLTSFIKANIEHVLLSVPANFLSIRELSFPFSDKNKIRDTISYELEGILLGDTSNYSIDYLITDSSEAETRILTACMDKQKLGDIINIFSSVGLEPAVITSIDLRLSSRNIKVLFEGPVAAEELRAQAAKEEIINPSINLRQKELAYKGDIERIKKSMRLTAVFVFLLLLIVGAGTTLKLISLKKENTLHTREIIKTYRESFPEETKIVDAVRQFKGNLNSLKEKKAILGGIPVLHFLLNIANLKNKGITLSEFNIDGENILVKGSAQSFENVDIFKNALSSLFTEVRVIDSKSSPDKKISFSIIMQVYGS